MAQRHDEGMGKTWEREWAQKLPDDAPWIVRLDGRGFHRWTRGLERPFDETLREAMIDTATAVLKEGGAEHAFTQSDEITLVFHHTGKREPAFGGKLQKLVSLLSACASTTFNERIARLNPEHHQRAGTALFDARAFAVPNTTAAVTAVAERSTDCWRNAVQSVGHWRYGHKRMLGRKTREVAEQLETEGLGMSQWPARHVYGVAIEQRRVRRAFTTQEITELAQKHEARTNPNLEVERTETVRVEGASYQDTQSAHARIFEWRSTQRVTPKHPREGK